MWSRQRALDVVRLGAQAVAYVYSLPMEEIKELIIMQGKI